MRGISKKRLFVIGGISVVIVGAILYALLVLKPFQAAPEYVWTEEVVTHSTEQPSEQKLAADFAWSGKPADPKKITIASANIDGFIQKVGVDQDNRIAVPNNVHLAGWFTESMIPGQKGLSIIDGHVNGLTSGDAIFKDLAKVKKDDVVTVTFGDDTVKSFKVIRTDSVKTEDAAAILYNKEPEVVSQLNLITCVGEYLSTERTYDQRFIVQAEMIAS